MSLEDKQKGGLILLKRRTQWRIDILEEVHVKQKAHVKAYDKQKVFEEAYGERRAPVKVNIEQETPEKVQDKETAPKKTQIPKNYEISMS